MARSVDRISPAGPARRAFVSSLAKGAVAASSLSLPAVLSARSRASARRDAGGQADRRPASADVTITGVDIFKYTLPRKEPFRIAIGLITSADNLLVRVNTDAGVYGLGEASPTAPVTGDDQETVFEVATLFARAIKGRNPLAIEERMRDIDRVLVGNSTIKSAFDVALFDLLGKISALPLYALLGGEKRAFHTDLTIGIDTPAVMAEKAISIKGQGFPAIKVKLGTNMADDLARIQAIRRAVGDETPLRVDANQGWSYVEALRALTALAPYGIQYCEQPVARWNHEGLRALKERVSIPLMADEAVFDHHDALKLASMGACDYFNIKLAKSSGIHQALRINAVAEAAGIRCGLGCMGESRLALTAAAHLVSARPNIEFADLDSALALKDDPVTGGIRFDRGRILLPDGPGHGADVDPDYLRRLKGITV